MRRLGLLLEGALVFAVVALLAGRAGYKAAAHWEVNWEGLAAVAHAQDVWYRAPEPRLSEIGFVQPPLPALMASLVVVPRPEPSSVRYAPPRLGAILLGLVAVLFLALCQQRGLRRWWAYPLTAALVLHPVLLSQAAGGSPAVLLVLLLLSALWCLDRWAEGGSQRYLLAASLLLGAALLTRYEMVLWIVLITGLVAVVSGRRGGYRQAEGTVLTFLLPIVYLAAGWIVACWLIQGDPWYFWRHTFGHPATGPAALFPAALLLTLLACPLLPGALCYVLIRPERRRRGLASLVVLAGSLLLVGIAGPLLTRLSGDVWSQLTVVVATAMAAGYLLTAQALAVGVRERDWWSRPTAAVALAAVGIGLVLLLGYGGRGLPRGTVDALEGRVAFADNCRAEAEAAARLTGELKRGERAIIAGWPGFAIALLEGELERLTLVPTAVPAKKLPAKPGTLLLVREAQAGALRSRWQQVLPTPGELRQIWRIAPWTCYRPAGATNPQPP